MASDISFEEKVDYIYKELKSQKRARFFSFAFKLSILAILVFWIININKVLENKTVISQISTTVWNIIKPIVKDLIQNENTLNMESIKKELLNNNLNK